MERKMMCTLDVSFPGHRGYYTAPCSNELHSWPWTCAGGPQRAPKTLRLSDLLSPSTLIMSFAVII
uniref:Uncharacterized protein n=1 Tax=Anguilla anguilla TaxID=7936 RepID=A0A0E9QNJ8_ANGAN